MRLLSIIIMEKVERDGKNWLCDKTQEVGRSVEVNEMVGLCYMTTCRGWEGLRRRVMDGETSLCDKTQKMVRSEENARQSGMVV
jgi:hypothetical protein